MTGWRRKGGEKSSLTGCWQLSQTRPGVARKCCYLKRMPGLSRALRCQEYSAGVFTGLPKVMKTFSRGPGRSSFQIHKCTDRVRPDRAEIEGFQERPLSPTGTEPAEDGIVLPIIGKLVPSEYSLPALAVVLGVVDGFNPCALWVLLYLISLVMTLKDRKRIRLIVGSFVLASGVLYFLFMTAWLNVFLLIGYIHAPD